MSSANNLDSAHFFSYILVYPFEHNLGYTIASFRFSKPAVCLNALACVLEVFSLNDFVLRPGTTSMGLSVASLEMFGGLNRLGFENCDAQVENPQERLKKRKSQWLGRKTARL